MTQQTKVSLSKINFNKLSLKYFKNKFYLNYDNKQLFIQLNEQKTPFGINDYKGNKNFNLLTKLTDEDKTQIVKLEKTIIDLMKESLETNKVKNSKKILKNLNDNFYSNIKKNKNEKYDDNLKIKTKLNYNDNRLFDFKIINHDKEIISNEVEKVINYFNYKTEFSMILTLQPYVMNNSFGLSLVLRKLKLNKEKEEIEDVDFTDDEEEDVDED